MQAALDFRLKSPTGSLRSCVVDKRTVVVDDTVLADVVDAVQLAHDADASLEEIRIAYELNQVTFFHYTTS